MSDRDIVTIDQQQKLINKTEEKYKNTKKVFFSLSLSLFNKTQQEGRKISNSTLRFKVSNTSCVPQCAMHDERVRERNEKESTESSA